MRCLLSAKEAVIFSWIALEHMMKVPVIFLPSVDAKVARSKVAENRPIPAAFIRMEKETLAKMEKLLNTAYYLCYLKLPFSSFAHFCSLQTKNGLDLGKTYINDHGCKELCKHISQSMKDDQTTAIRNARFLSIMADGSTDVSVIEEEVIYVRFVSASGVPETFYVGLKEVENAKAPGVLKAIEAVMDEKDEQWKAKLISTGTDGASVMLGRCGGVVALLKEQIPHLIGIHCVAHNLGLAFADTVKEMRLKRS